MSFPVHCKSFFTLSIHLCLSLLSLYLRPVLPVHFAGDLDSGVIHLLDMSLYICRCVIAIYYAFYSTICNLSVCLSALLVNKRVHIEVIVADASLLYHCFTGCAWLPVGALEALRLCAI